jgi:hypothetical protein
MIQNVMAEPIVFLSCTLGVIGTAILIGGPMIIQQKKEDDIREQIVQAKIREGMRLIDQNK